MIKNLIHKFITISLLVGLSFYPIDASQLHSPHKNAIEFINTQELEGLHGRIIRGTHSDHFKYLNSDQNRKLAFLIGSDGLTMLKDKNGHEILVAIGYPLEYIEQIANQGNQFKLVLFSEHNGAQIATWHNLLHQAAEAYPDIADDLLRHQKSLEVLPFEHYENAAGYQFRDVEKVGKSDPRFMTYERYLNSSRSLLDTRAFLFFTLRLNELYSGDGYTYDYEGNRGLKEYIVPNQALEDFEDYLLLDIIVELPEMIEEPLDYALAS